MAAYTPDMLADVEFVHSEVEGEPPPIEALGPIDFAWFSGSRTSVNPETLESLLARLSDGGLAVIENPPAHITFPPPSSVMNDEGDRGGDTREIRYALVNVNGCRWLVAGTPVPVDKLLDGRSIGVEILDSDRALVRIPSSLSNHHAVTTSILTSDGLNLEAGWAEVRKAFPLVTVDDFARAIAAGQLIEERIVGRHCGDLGDRLAQYLTVVQHVRATGAPRVDVLEIGTLFGGSCLMNLCAMRDLAIDGKVTCIDPLAGYYSESTDPKTGLAVDPDTLYLNLARCGFSADRIDLRRCLSSAPEARAGLVAGSFAMLMIDGDHSADGIRDDWNAFVPYLAPDGTVLIDDYADPVWPDITVVADELSTTTGWIPIAALGTTLIVRRDGPSARIDSARAPGGGAPTVGLIARALTEDTRAMTHWSVRLASVLAHLRRWSEMDRQLELGRSAIARGEWPVAEMHLADVISRADAAPSVLIRACLGLADCADQRLDHVRAIEYAQRAVDLERKWVTYGNPHLYATNRLRRARAAAALERVSA